MKFATMLNRHHDDAISIKLGFRTNLVIIREANQPIPIIPVANWSYIKKDSPHIIRYIR